MNVITKAGRKVAVLAAALSVGFVGCDRIERVSAAGVEPGGGGEPSFSGPYTYENLSIHLIHGPDEVEGDEFVTLQEAMEQGLVTVYETGEVGELAIENRSTSVSVFIQSGDIVKGGRQDRTLAYDVVVPPRSGKMPVKSFCVEAGRWQRRGGEDAAQFSSNTEMLASRSLKLAAKEKGDQSAVWAGVAEAQDKLSENVGKDVRSAQSDSSLQLTLEDADLVRMVEEYTEALEGAVEGKEDVIGFAFGINGEVNSVDVYASSDIFGRMWPKLLKAAVVEAIGEYQGKEASPEVTEEAVKDLMELADAVEEETRQAVSEGAHMNTRSNDEAVVFEIVDRQRGDAVLHKNYIRK